MKDSKPAIKSMSEIVNKEHSAGIMLGAGIYPSETMGDLVNLYIGLGYRLSDIPEWSALRNRAAVSFGSSEHAALVARIPL